MKARRAELVVVYEDVDVSSSIAEYLTSFSYSDAGSGTLDDLQLTLEDRHQLWQGDWMGKKGDTITAAIRTVNWNKAGEAQLLICGTFEVDGMSSSGPPDVLNIKAVSIPFDSNVRFEKKTRAWEKVKLSTLAKDIAKNAGYKLVFELTDDPEYDRVDQTDQSDLAFLLERAKNEGVGMKVTDGQIVLFDELVYEQQGPVAEIARGAGRVLSYSFEDNMADASYVACQVAYQEPRSKKTVTHTYRPPGAPTKGPVLKINERFASIKEADRIGRKRLREKNKNAVKASLKLPGDVRLVTTATVTLAGWKNFDGKYIIESSKHDVGGSGYTTSLELRKVLEGY
ncbi:MULTISPECIES: phage late control D family protein [Paenibacillus]|uniref:phage late control D family protein n=1 Tax=Paenibacillus TaxID=44249 RepID=UPI0022B92707|nr:contractile injection system protein, VgrG/Pvc8 family [Paenibacillus caseinilyticus]MCZ8520122.1 contractile injection system protein, VgrG/Pvc8 family [Paenibacillus caseinilyticus]